MVNQPRRGEAFTLLEVMVAVVILAVGLTSLFSSEAGAIRVAQRARTTTIATLLARCKMAEVEERIAKEGWPGAAIDDRDECCEGAEHEGFTCEWKVERVVLPEKEADKENVLDKLVDTKKQADSKGPGDPTSFGIPVSGLSKSGSEAGGSDVLTSLAIELAFPILKPVIEEQVRRATVEVRWKEGSKEQTFEVVQFLVNELPIVVPDPANTPGATPPTTTPTTPPAPQKPGGAGKAVTP